MAGITVGGTDDHWILNPVTGGAMKRASKLRWYATLTGGAPLTLTFNGQSVNQIPVPRGGFYPEHTWPDGVTVAYAVALENSRATDANFAAATRIKHVPPGTGGGGGGVSVIDNGNGTLSTASTAIVDNGDGTLTIGA